MPSGALLQSHTYRIACACSLALVVFVVARAPLWNSAMAGARVQLASGHVALAPTAWQCSDAPYISSTTVAYICSTTVDGGKLVARVVWGADRLISCTTTFRGRPVPCTPRLWYAPRLKPFLEIGDLPGVSFRAAMLERPWRVLDMGLLGEGGPLHMWAGLVGAFLLALRASALVRRGGIWWSARLGIATLTFTVLNAVWFMQRLVMGYID